VSDLLFSAFLLLFPFACFAGIWWGIHNMNAHDTRERQRRAAREVTRRHTILP
jgi:hypothetical protein